MFFCSAVTYFEVKVVTVCNCLQQQILKSYFWPEQSGKDTSGCVFSMCPGLRTHYRKGKLIDIIWLHPTARYDLKFLEQRW